MFLKRLIIRGMKIPITKTISAKEPAGVFSLPDFIINWFGHSKITSKTLEDFGISWDNDHIVIPIHDENGVFLFNKYRRSPLNENGIKYTYDKGGKMALFGLDKIKDIKHVLYVEGEKDCMTAWAHNIPAVSSTGGAMSFAQDWAEILKDKEITLLLDNDEAGGKGMARILDFIPTAKIVFLPDRPGIKDISEYVSNGGDLHALLKSAKHFAGLEEVIEDRVQRVALWKSVFFHDAFVKAHTEFPKDDYIPNRNDGDDLARAKAYPISSLVKFNRAGKALCPAHSEKTPSLHFYQKQNRAYCFGGCGRGFDSIDIYMMLNNCDFKEAVQKLK